MNDDGTDKTPPEPEGVWIVWSSQSRIDGMNGIYPDNRELDALRQINNSGYGWVEFVPFGSMN